MVQIAASTIAIAVTPPPSDSPAAQSGTGDFALALGKLRRCGPPPNGTTGEGEANSIARAGRQGVAEPGKDLPEAAFDCEGEAENDAAHAGPGELTEASQDPAFAWFALPGLAASSLAPAGPAESSPGAAAPVVPHLAPASLPAEADAATAIAAPRAADAATGPAVTMIATLLRDALAKAESAPAQVGDPREAARSAPPAPSVLRTIPLGEAASAFSAVFAPPAGFSPLQRGVHRDLDQPAPIALAAPAASGIVAVAAASGAQMSGLDLRRQEWMGQMIDTIEAMREAAPVRETRIALSPDALGKIDIAVRQEGDRVHVHINAETQAARQILIDAQARLIEIAEQRGVRLGQMTVDQQGAQPQSGQRHPDAPQPGFSAPAPARAESASTETDERIA